MASVDTKQNSWGKLRSRYAGRFDYRPPPIEGTSRPVVETANTRVSLIQSRLAHQ